MYKTDAEVVAGYKSIDRYEGHERQMIISIRSMLTEIEAALFDKTIGQSDAPLGMIANLFAQALVARSQKLSA